jgi:hypothetical protein
VSPPLDLAACADALDRPANFLYQSYFVRNLKAAYRRRQRLRPDLYQAGRERGLRTIREYDEVITAHYGGYASAEEYYATSSSGPRLGALTRPALVLAALDDPMARVRPRAAGDDCHRRARGLRGPDPCPRALLGGGARAGLRDRRPGRESGRGERSRARRG